MLFNVNIFKLLKYGKSLIVVERKNYKMINNREIKLEKYARVLRVITKLNFFSF